MTRPGFAIARMVLMASLTLPVPIFGLGAQDSGKPKLSDVDRGFLRNATMANNYEITAGQYLLANSKSEEVRKFARVMVDDHTTLNDRLKAISTAADPSVSLPTMLDANGTAWMSALRTAGGNLDSTFKMQMEAAHTAAQAAFKSYLEAAGGNAQLRGVVSAAQSMIDQHLEAAKRLPGH